VWSINRKGLIHTVENESKNRIKKKHKKCSIDSDAAFFDLKGVKKITCPHLHEIFLLTLHNISEVGD